MLSFTAHALNRTTRAVAAAESPEEALAAILSAARGSLGASGAAIVRARQGRMVTAASQNLELPDSPFDQRTLAQDGLTSYPLAVGGQLEGMLLLAGAGPAVNPRSSPLTGLLDLAALALRNARLSDENARIAVANSNLTRQADARALVVSAVHSINVAASTTADLTVLTGLVVDHARDLLQVDGATLYWWDEQDGELRALAGNLPGTAGKPEPVHAGEGASGIAFARAGPVVVEDYASWSRATPIGIASGVATVVAVPLAIDDQVAGVIELSTHLPRRYTSDQLEMLALFATQVTPLLRRRERERTVGGAVSLAAPAQQAERQLSSADATGVGGRDERERVDAQLRGQNKALELIASGRPLTEVLEQLTRQAEAQIDGLVAAIVLFDQAGSQPRLGAAPGLPPELRQALSDFVGDLPSGGRARALYGGERIVVEDLERDPLGQEQSDLTLAYCLRAAWSVPIVDPGGATLGTYALFYRVPRRPVAWETELIESLARIAAIAIAAEARAERAPAPGSSACTQIVLDLLTDAVLVVGAKGEIVQANSAARELLAAPGGALVGARVDELQWQAGEQASDGTRLADLIDPTVAAHQRELRLSRADGAEEWLLASSTPFDHGSAGRGSIVTLRVVTEERQRQQQTVAGAKLRVLGQIAGGVAHDLNQYLGLVAGHGELALRSLHDGMPETSTLEDSLYAIVQAAMDGAATVRRLLAFARPNPEGPAQRLDLANLFSEVARLTAPRWRDGSQAAGRPINLKVECEPQLEIDGWHSSLREACTNLVLNAVDAMPEGGSILLTGRSRGERVVVEIGDTGVGMPPEVQARAFEPFFTTKGERGTGLGLPMVFNIVERHHGTIECDSSPSRGTTFRMEFPAAREQKLASNGTCPAVARRPLRILAVDDEPALGRMLALLLASDSHEVVVAESGESALDQLGHQHFDLVLSDIGMGDGMNGWELADAVRKRYPGVHFMLATGWGAQIDPADARRRGVQAVLSKPYRLSDLQEHLAAL